MTRIHKLWHLPTPERYVLVRAVYWLVTIRLALWLLPFQTLRRVVRRLAQSPNERQQTTPSSPPERLAWAVAVASQYVPATSTCLPRALSTQILLRRAGFPSCLHIGVGRSAQGTFQAHAWVEHHERVIIGDFPCGAYTSLWVLESPNSYSLLPSSSAFPCCICLAHDCA